MGFNRHKRQQRDHRRARQTARLVTAAGWIATPTQLETLLRRDPQLASDERRLQAVMAHIRTVASHLKAV